MAGHMEYNFANEFPLHQKVNYKENISPKFFAKDEDSKAVNNNKIQKTWFNKLKSILSCSFFKDFCNETSIHGFNHIVAPRRHFLEKLGWFIATMLAGLGALQLCLEQWQRYVASPTVVALEKDYRNWNNSFMALTACQQYKHTRDTENFLKTTWGVTPQDDKYQYYLRFVEVVANSTINNMDLYAPYKDDPTLKEVNLFDVATKVITPLSSSVLWFDKSVNKSFVNVMTDRGICHTINSIVSQDQAITISGSKNFKPLDQMVQCSYLTHPCYLRIEVSDICVSYYVHSSYDILDISTELVRNLCKGNDANTDWSVVETKASSDVRDLTIDQRKCRYHDEPYEGAAVFSVRICRRRCRTNIALKNCGCRPFFYFQEAGEACDPAGMVCLGKHIEDILHPENCKCPPPCEEAAYELTSIKETVWSGPLGARNSIKVGLVAPRSRYRRQILFCFEDLVVSFGGAAGLFLGCSFLSGVEIVYFIIERLVMFSGKMLFKDRFKRLYNGRTNKKQLSLNNQRQKNANSTEEYNIAMDENPRQIIVKKYIKTIAVFDPQK